MKIIERIVLSLALLTIAACGENTHGGIGTSPSGPEVAEDYWETWCSHMVECGVDVSPECVEGGMALSGDSVNGKVNGDETDVVECFEAVQAQACEVRSAPTKCVEVMPFLT